MIELKELNKTLGSRHIIKDLSIKFDARSIGIYGASGIGKTTLLRIISGLETIDSGEVWINNKLMSNKNEYVHPSKRYLSFVFQFPTLWPHMTVYQNICYGVGKNMSSKKQIEIEELMKKLFINKLGSKKPATLSGGEAKRVAIARALALGKPYILLDEPLVHLDVETKRNTIDMIHDVLETTKQNVIYVSHDLQSIHQLGDQVYELKTNGLHQVKEVNYGFSNS